MGLNASEVSRMRQYERFIGEAIENLRMVKMYRTPQALRSSGRNFTLIPPSFYAPAFEVGLGFAVPCHEYYFCISYSVGPHGVVPDRAID